MRNILVTRQLRYIYAIQNVARRKTSLEYWFKNCKILKIRFTDCRPLFSQYSMEKMEDILHRRDHTVITFLGGGGGGKGAGCFAFSSTCVLSVLVSFFFILVSLTDNDL